MTSFIAAEGSGRSTSVIPAVPAAASVATSAFIPDLLCRVLDPLPARLELLPSPNGAATTGVPRARSRADGRRRRAIPATDRDHRLSGLGGGADVQRRAAMVI